MTTFTLNNGHTFMKKDNGYCFAIVKNTKTRIALPVFNANYEQFVKEENERQNVANEFVNIDPIGEREDDEELEAMVQEAEESATDEALAEIAAEMDLPGVWVDAAEQELDAAAEDDNVSLEEYVEKVQKIEKQKKIRKERKAKAAKKNAAFTYTVNGEVIVTLTEKQVDFIKHLPDTYFWEHGIDSCIWVDCLCDDIKGQFAGKPMTVGAMISTLCEKGLGIRSKVNGKKATAFELTALGKQVFADPEWGLN